MNAEDIPWEKYTCIYTGYILSQRRAVFVRLCGTIKHRERQSRTLFLSRITTHIDMTYLRLPRQNTWEMQLGTWNILLCLWFLRSIWNFSTGEIFSTNTATHISHEFVWYQFCSCSAIGNIYISEKQKRVGKKAYCSKQSLQTATGVVGHLSKLFIKNSTANSLWHVVQQCLTLNSLHLST